MDLLLTIQFCCMIMSSPFPHPGMSGDFVHLLLELYSLSVKILWAFYYECCRLCKTFFPEVCLVTPSIPVYSYIAGG